MIWFQVWKIRGQNPLTEKSDHGRLHVENVRKAQPFRSGPFWLRSGPRWGRAFARLNLFLWRHPLCNQRIRRRMVAGNVFMRTPTVCWIEVKVSVLCALQYMPWNLLLSKFRKNFDISNTRSLLGLAQKHICNIEEIVFISSNFLFFFKDNFFNYVSNMLPSKS